MTFQGDQHTVQNIKAYTFKTYDISARIFSVFYRQEVYQFFFFNCF
jgi:hypothetical protein